MNNNKSIENFLNFLNKYMYHINPDNVKFIVDIIRSYGDIINTYDIYGHNALLLAISNGNIDVTRALLENPDIDVNVHTTHGNTPITMYAYNNKYIDILKLLLSHENIDINMCDNSGMTLLTIAVRNNDIKLVTKLLKKYNADPNIYTRNDTILSSATNNDHQDIFKLLLEHPNINPNIQTIRLLRTPLTQAIIGNNERISYIKSLLSHPDIDVNIKDKKNMTALMYAIKYDNMDVIQLLLSHPDIDINITNDDNQTAVELATERNIDILALMDNQ